MGPRLRAESRVRDSERTTASSTCSFPWPWPRPPSPPSKQNRTSPQAHNSTAAGPHDQARRAARQKPPRSRPLGARGPGVPRRRAHPAASPGDGPDPSSHGRTAPCGRGRCSAPGKRLPGDPGAPSLLSGSPRVAPSRPKAARQRALLEPPQGGEEVWDLCQFSLGMPHAGRCHPPPPAAKTGLQEKKKKKTNQTTTDRANKSTFAKLSAKN